MEDYNCPFSFDELSDSLKKASGTATGPHNIHYQFLKHLPFVSKHALLSILIIYLLAASLSVQIPGSRPP